MEKRSRVDLLNTWVPLIRSPESPGRVQPCSKWALEVDPRAMQICPMALAGVCNLDLENTLYASVNTSFIRMPDVSFVNLGFFKDTEESLISIIYFSLQFFSAYHWS